MTDSIPPLPAPVPQQDVLVSVETPAATPDVLPPVVTVIEPETATPVVAMDTARKEKLTLQDLVEQAAFLEKQLQDMRKELAAREAAEDERAMEDANWFERELAQEKLEKTRNKIRDEASGESV